MPVILNYISFGLLDLEFWGLDKLLRRAQQRGWRLQHGPNALVAEGTPLVMLATVDRESEGSVLRYEKVVQLMREMREQCAEILAVANRGDEAVSGVATHTIFVEEAGEALLPICEVIPLQMLAYSMAVNSGIDVDRPRNLTKAVLAESLD